MSEVPPTRFTLSDLNNIEPVIPRKKDTLIPNHRMEYQYGRLSKFIEDRGINVKWEHAYMCPCRNKKTMAPDPNCEICRGKGVAYLEPINTKVAIQSQEREVNNADLGLYSSGTAIGTTLPNIMITFRDRITVPEVAIGQSMIFDVTPERVNRGFWLPYDVKAITLAVTEGNRKLVEGTDYTINLNTNTIYPKAELLGKNMSINLQTTLRYIVIDLLKESRYQYTDKGTKMEQFDDLPKKVLLKREDAWVNHMPFSGDETTTGTFIEEDPKRDMQVGGFFGGALNG